MSGAKGLGVAVLALMLEAGGGRAQSPAPVAPAEGTPSVAAQPGDPAPAGAAAGSSAAGTATPGPEGAKAGATVTFLFDRQGLEVPHYLLTVHEDGSGRYEADEAPVSGGVGRHVDRAIVVSPTTAGKIFEAARAVKDFHAPCASKIKNLANTGAKTLSYVGPDGSGSCFYNYSELKPVQGLTQTFQAMAFTLDEGRRLEFKKRFDRLGLDAELASLQHAQEQNEAVEMGMIADVLVKIAKDTELMERVRLRAAKLSELEQKAQ